MEQAVLFCLALLPIVWLITALTGLKMAAHRAGLLALLIGAALALFVWKMPAVNCLTAALEGVALALWPIILVIFAALFTYNLTLQTKAMEDIKRMIGGISADRRVLVLLIGWCFGGFLEGMAGFGTAVAIPASMLLALGFDPVPAAVACLLSNAMPTAFGSIGIPTVTLAQVTGLKAVPLAFATMVQMVPIMILTPFLMVALAEKSFRALKGVWPVALTAGVSFVLPSLLVARFLGAELPVRRLRLFSRSDRRFRKAVSEKRACGRIHDRQGFRNIRAPFLPTRPDRMDAFRPDLFSPSADIQSDPSAA